MVALPDPSVRSAAGIDTFERALLWSGLLLSRISPLIELDLSGDAVGLSLDLPAGPGDPFIPSAIASGSPEVLINSPPPSPGVAYALPSPPSGTDTLERYAVWAAKHCGFALVQQGSRLLMSGELPIDRSLWLLTGNLLRALLVGDRFDCNFALAGTGLIEFSAYLEIDLAAVLSGDVSFSVTGSAYLNPPPLGPATGLITFSADGAEMSPIFPTASASISFTAEAAMREIDDLIAGLEFTGEAAMREIDNLIAAISFSSSAEPAGETGTGLITFSGRAEFLWLEGTGSISFTAEAVPEDFLSASITFTASAALLDDLASNQISPPTITFTAEADLEDSLIAAISFSATAELEDFLIASISFTAEARLSLPLEGTGAITFSGDATFLWLEGTGTISFYSNADVEWSLAGDGSITFTAEALLDECLVPCGSAVKQVDYTEFYLGAIDVS